MTEYKSEIGKIVKCEECEGYYYSNFDKVCPCSRMVEDDE